MRTKLLLRRSGLEPIAIATDAVQQATDVANGITPYSLVKKEMPVTFFSRAPKTSTLSIGTTPTLITKPPHNFPYLLINPSLSVGLTNNQLVFNGTVNAAGNSELTPIGVANYLSAHFYLNVIAGGSGTWDIIAQSYDPYSGNWADSQTIFTAINGATGATYYAFPNEMGIDTDFAIRWNPTAAGSMTFSLSMDLKNGIPGSSSGVTRTIYFGGPDVTSTNAGFQLLEGEKETIMLAPDLSLYAVALVPTNLKIAIM